MNSEKMMNPEELTEEELIAHLNELHRQLAEIREQSTAQDNQLKKSGAAHRRIFVVMHRLPTRINRTHGPEGWTFSELPGSVSGAFAALKGKTSFVWVGCPHVEVDYHEEEPLRRRLLHDFSSIPVFLNAEMDDLYYNGFCKQVLWPLLHYVLGGSSGASVFDERLWNAYYSCNSRFAEVLTEHYQEGDMVWVHDYHLFLLPLMLRRRLRHVNIGFFLHTPFPSSEIFRILPVRQEVLQGILAANLIGFNTYDYSRHFLTACSRLLGVETSPRGCIYEDHFVSVSVFPVGIDPERFVGALATPDVQKRVMMLKHKYAGKKIVVGVDTLDYIKGMPHKLLAFETFLNRYPEFKGKVILIQVAEPPAAETISEYRRLQRQVNEMVGRINGRFASVDFSPIHYLNQAIGFDETCALYSIADACLITSVRDGMNMVAHEFVVCQREKSGALILSEFAGAAQSLSGAIHINPWDTEEVAKAIYDALTMSENDRRLRHVQLYDFVCTHTSVFWAKNFIDEMRDAGAKDSEVQKAPPPLDVARLIGAYQKAATRLLVVDYDGTLVATQALSHAAQPSAALLELLSTLASIPSNTVFIVSARTPENVAEWFGGVHNVGLAAEHGFKYRWPLNPDDESGGAEDVHENDADSWEQLVPGLDVAWMDVVLPVFRAFTDRTPGSYIEHKDSAITWHFRDADPDFGSWQAKELQEVLVPKLVNVPVEVIMGDEGWLTIRPQGVNKGVFVNHILAQLQDDHPDAPHVEFVLCVGNDRTDEDMFSALKGDPQRVFTVKIGKRSSQANYSLPDSPALLDLLTTLATV